MKGLSLLLLILNLGCASVGVNRSATTVDREILVPADVQPPPVAAAIPGALRPPSTASAPPGPLHRVPLLQHFQRVLDASPVFNGEILPSRIDQLRIFDCEALNFWTFTNLHAEVSYELNFSFDGGKTWKRTRERTVCSVASDADGRLILYLPGPIPPHPRLVPSKTNISSWYQDPSAQLH